MLVGDEEEIGADGLDRRIAELESAGREPLAHLAERVDEHAPVRRDLECRLTEPPDARHRRTLQRSSGGEALEPLHE